MQQFFVNETLEQPLALLDLLSYYEANPLNTVLGGKAGNVLLTGMGASFHAAAITAYRLQQQNVMAQAIEATEILNYPGLSLKQCAQLVYISQSGSSAEVEQVFSQLPSHIETIGVTNTSDSVLCQLAGTVLSVRAGEERTVATKTYINSLALLALLAGTSAQALHNIQGRIQHLLDTAEATRSLWMETISPSHTIYFLGHGPHAVTARHSAMMVGEWTKRPSVYASIGAFRHGFLEAVNQDTVVVIFAPRGVCQQSAYDLADELTGYGTRVLLVENGHTRRMGEVAPSNPLDDELLSPMLDAIPVQLFIEAFARQTEAGDGFRYISKVIRQL